MSDLNNRGRHGGRPSREGPALSGPQWSGLNATGLFPRDRGRHGGRPSREGPALPGPGSMLSDFGGTEFAAEEWTGADLDD